MVKERLTEIFRNLFEDDEIVLAENTTAEDIDGWDSLAHIQLISMCEKEFGIKFTTAEVLHMANVGSLISLIEKKTA